MASWAKPEPISPPERNGLALVPPPDFAIRSIGRSLPRVQTPEGWVKKKDRAREGKVWVGYFHLWERKPDGTSVRRKKEKTLGPATKPRHEALKELSDYIVKFGQERTRPVSSICTFAELWNAYCAVKSGQWSKSTNEIITCLFARHVIPPLGNQRIEEIRLTPLQLLVNSVAERGFSKSVVCKIRVYLKACLEYAVDEDLLGKNPAKKVVLPKIRKKPCGRFLEVHEFQALLSEAPPREHLVLRILGVCGLRAAEALVLRIEDFEGDQLRIDEALKDRMTGEERIGDTKTDESDNFVPVPPDLRKEIEAWIGEHPERENPRAFLFPNARGRAFSVGNYLKRYLKPLGELVGIHDLTHQTFRRTSSTHMQNHATVKDMQRHLRHSDPQTTLKHYAKVIPASLRAAVAALDGGDQRRFDQALIPGVPSGYRYAVGPLAIPVGIASSNCLCGPPGSYKSCLRLGLSSRTGAATPRGSERRPRRPSAAKASDTRGHKTIAQRAVSIDAWRGLT